MSKCTVLLERSYYLLSFTIINSEQLELKTRTDLIHINPLLGGWREGGRINMIGDNTNTGCFSYIQHSSETCSTLLSDSGSITVSYKKRLEKAQ